MTMQAHNRKGFFPLNPNAHIGEYKVASTQTLAAGDVVILSSNQVAIAVTTSSELLGVMAEPAVTKDENTLVKVYDDPDEIFVGRFSGTTAYLTGDKCDLTGGTGAMQLAASTDSYHHFVLLGPVAPEETSTAVGAQWRVRLNLLALTEVSS